MVNFPTHSFNPISFKVGDLREPKVASDNPTGDSTSTEEETVPQQSIQATSSQQEVAVEIHTRDQTEGEGKITPSTAENPPAENPPAENPPAENPPAENPPAENPPAENPPAENPPAETSSEDKTSIESPSSDHVTFKGDPPVEEKETDENEGISARTDANGCVSTDEKVGSTPPLQRMLSYAKQVSVAEKPSTYNLYAMTVSCVLCVCVCVCVCVVCVGVRCVGRYTHTHVHICTHTHTHTHLHAQTHFFFLNNFIIINNNLHVYNNKGAMLNKVIANTFSR